MAAAEPPAYLSVREVAERLGLSQKTIRRRVLDGSLPVLRLSPTGALRIQRSALEPQECEEG